MENGNSFLHALEDFEKRKELTPELEQYLRHIAKTGETIYPWNRLKPVFLLKLEKVMQEFNDETPKVDGPPTPNVENLSYEEMKERVVNIIDSFTGPPFTMQRLCELVTDPKKHYKRSDKFLRGVEKNVLVVSTVHGGASRRMSTGGDKLVNGITSQDGGGDSLSVAMPPPPCPAPHLPPIPAGASSLPPFPPGDHDHLETPSLAACNDISDTTSPSSPVSDHTGTNGEESHNQSGETTVDKEDDSLQNNTYTEQLEDRSRIADDIGGEDSAPSDSSTSEDSSESSLSDDTPTSAPDGNPTETVSSEETTFSTEPSHPADSTSQSMETMFPIEPTESASTGESTDSRDGTDSSEVSEEMSTSPEMEPYTRPTRACTRSADALEEEDDSGSPRKIRRIEEPQETDQSEQTTASPDQPATDQPQPSSEQEASPSQSEDSSEEQKAEDGEEPMEQD